MNACERTAKTVTVPSHHIFFPPVGHTAELTVIQNRPDNVVRFLLESDFNNTRFGYVLGQNGHVRGLIRIRIKVICQLP